MKRILIALAAAASLGVLALGSPATAAVTTVYSSIPDPLPPNVPSIGNEAYSDDEVGDHIAFTASALPRTAETVTVLLSSWGCETGSWLTGCVTTPGATFSHPLTLNLYAVDNSGQVPATGALLATVTDTFAIPYRPSADAGAHAASPGCSSGTGWYDAASDSCFNGLAYEISFDLSSLALALPDELIWGIAYNTTHHGATPIGEGAACYVTPAGCPYDSLNVGLSGAATVGTDIDPTAIFVDSTWNAMYGPSPCSQTPLDEFRYACDWAGYVPAARFTALDDSDATPPEFSIRAKVGGGNVINEYLPEYVIDTWATKQVTVYLGCTDPEPDVSGIDIFRGDKAVTFYDGIHYYSTGASDECIDNAGNEAAPLGPIGPIKVDTKAPTCKPAPTTHYINRSTTGTVSFALNLFDATSGIDTVSPSYVVSGGAQLLGTSGANGETVEVKMGSSTAGRVDITWVVNDVAGNSTVCKGVVRAR